MKEISTEYTGEMSTDSFDIESKISKLQFNLIQLQSRVEISTSLYPIEIINFNRKIVFFYTASSWLISASARYVLVSIFSLKSFVFSFFQQVVVVHKLHTLRY